jgi:hypothetical protein
VVFAGVVEGAVMKEVFDVSVESSETEIIESTYTDKWRNRVFRIDNGGQEITVTAWGSNDNENWEYWDSITIDSDKSDKIILGINHWWYAKITGKTTQPASTSIVDAQLTYHIPE